MTTMIRSDDTHDSDPLIVAIKIADRVKLKEDMLSPNL